MPKIVYVERRPGPLVSIEKAFREIARNLPARLAIEFQQMPYGWRVYEAVRNLLFYKPVDADLYHITGHVHYIAFRLPPERTVLSILDVRFVLFNSGLRRWVLKKLYLDLPIRRMRYVTTISEKVKEEIVELTGCSPGKIRVLQMPLLSHLASGDGRPFNSESPRILQVGTMVNKNVPRLVESIRGIACTLIIVGDLSDEVRASLRNNQVHFENYVGIPDEELRSLYEGADMVTFCSTYEGFGMPIIEAQAMRKPLITSNISPLKDVAGDGAFLIDPFSVASIRSGIETIIRDADVRQRVIQAGIVNAQKYSADRVGAEYGAFYDEILEGLRCRY